MEYLIDAQVKMLSRAYAPRNNHRGSRRWAKLQGVSEEVRKGISFLEEVLPHMCSGVD